MRNCRRRVASLKVRSESFYIRPFILVITLVSQYDEWYLRNIKAYRKETISLFSLVSESSLKRTYRLFLSLNVAKLAWFVDKFDRSAAYRDMILFSRTSLFVFAVNSLSPCSATAAGTFRLSRARARIRSFRALWRDELAGSASRKARRKARHKCIVKSGNENSFDTSLTVD